MYGSMFFLRFTTLDDGPRRPLRLELSDEDVNQPCQHASNGAQGYALGGAVSYERGNPVIVTATVPAPFFSVREMPVIRPLRGWRV